MSPIKHFLIQKYLYLEQFLVTEDLFQIELNF